MNADVRSLSWLDSEVWAESVLLRFQTVPFYLVATLVHLLFFLVFGSYEVTQVRRGEVAIFLAPLVSTKPSDYVPPPPPPPADRKEQQTMTESSRGVVRATMVASARPITAATPLPSPTAVSIAVPTVTSPVPARGGLGRSTVKDFSRVKVASIYVNRFGTRRGTAVTQYGGTRHGEAAVLRALNWLRANQNPDGSWGGHYRSAMTGLSLLTYLAHGERQDSREYGETVQRGVQWLMDFGKRNKNRLGNEHLEYQHAIATYALAEDYALTQISDLLTVLEGAVQLIVSNQAPNGSWDYGYNKVGREDPKRPGGDTSITGWNVQALKAAQLAGIKVPGIESAMQKALGFLRGVYDDKKHRFGYAIRGGGSPALNGVGVLCMQFIGAGDAKEARGALRTMSDYKCEWEKGSEASSYAWYYITQALFQAGGNYWTPWNRMFREEILRYQKADGSWPVPGSLGGPPTSGWRQVTDPKDQPVYHTSLLCMMARGLLPLPADVQVRAAARLAAARFRGKSAPPDFINLNPHLKDFIRTTATTCLHGAGVTALRRRQLAGDPRITILTYHSVTPADFERHLQWLTARYRIVPLAEAVEWIRGGGRDEGQRVVITFDDGYKSFHRDIRPLLQKYRTPAALFAVSEFIGTDRLLWWDLIEVLLRRATANEVLLRGRRWALDCSALVVHAKTLLEEPDKLRWIEELRAALGVELPRATGTEFELCSWNELRELAADPLVTVGGHTCTHPILSRVSAEVAGQEIERGKTILEEQLQRPARFFAYPNGQEVDFSRVHVEQLRAAGFECALTTVEGVCGRGADLFQLPRKNVGGRFTNATLACKLTGLWLSLG